MSLAGVAKETTAIVERGTYTAPSGTVCDVRESIADAVAGTRLFTPELAAAALARTRDDGAAPTIEVTAETTAAAARRLYANGQKVCALNFASAKNPGGGWTGGAKAQEEDLARCSALVACQLTQRAYYDVNRACESMLYTDHLIYSPRVPFFRDDRLDLVEEPYLCSVITAPAPNAGEARRRDEPRAAISAALRQRAGMVLAVAEDAGERTLVLGAWGCGVFRNDPAEVAEVFATWLASDRFRGAFDHVTFAIYDRSKEKATLRAFEERFSSSRPA
jgi:uncharacterized protein (TIGR02452 family)